MSQNRNLTIALVVALVLWILYFLRPRGTVETFETFDLSGLGGPGIVNFPQPLKDFAVAIARAEGFYVHDSIPQRLNNPGDLKLDGEEITEFQSVDQGWYALHRQLWLIVTGQSAHYNLDTTIREMGRKWTATITEQEAWARNVANSMNVSIDTPLWQVLV